MEIESSCIKECTQIFSTIGTPHYLLSKDYTKKEIERSKGFTKRFVFNLYFKIIVIFRFVD